MGATRSQLGAGLAALSLLGLGACATSPAPSAAAPLATAQAERFEADRAAILAMAGEFDVTFDFKETVSFVEGYTPKEPYLTGGREVVRVIADEGDFISLQHILVVGGPEQFPIKHWRQDWAYEPNTVLEFVGANAWATRATTPSERAGAWSQTVYQVDDAPRYAGLARWSHDNGAPAWTSDPSLRPLPRRDATKRDDYHAILAVNRHALTPLGWVHEQDNSKLIQAGPLAADGDQVLVREVAVNTYNRTDDLAAEIADDYWAKTQDYWAGVRAIWDEMADTHQTFGLTIQGEPEALYFPILSLADAIASGETSVETAMAEARTVITDFTDTTPADTRTRLEATVLAAAEPETF